MQAQGNENFFYFLRWRLRLRIRLHLRYASSHVLAYAFICVARVNQPLCELVSFTSEKQWGLYQNKVTPSLVSNQMLGH